MQYRFLDPGAERLIAVSEYPVENTIAVAVRSTGYDTDQDEVLRLSIVGIDGDALFDKAVKPQNAEDWPASDATGGIAPADVEDSPELYQFEEQIGELFEGASAVVAAHMGFAKEIIESSWVTLPAFDGHDLVELFCQTHCTADHPGKPATAASLDGIAAYYEIPVGGDSPLDDARTCAACYKAIVDEHVRERAAKGDAYWAEHNERVAAEAAENERVNEAVAKREKNFNRMNGLLWVAACLIFISLDIQLCQRGGDVGLMVVCGAFAVFALVRTVVNFRR